jgi:hypothetical protein
VAARFHSITTEKLAGGIFLAIAAETFKNYNNEKNKHLNICNFIEQPYRNGAI